MATYMTSVNLIDIIEKTTVNNNSGDQTRFNPQNRVVPADPHAIVGFKVRNEQGQIIEINPEATGQTEEQKDSEDRLRAIADGRACDVLSKVALETRFRGGNFTFPRDTSLTLDETERDFGTDIVPFDQEILVQYIALRQGIIDADVRGAPILVPFRHTIPNTNKSISSTEADMRHFRRIILNYLNSRTQAQLDEAVLYVNKLRDEPDPNPDAGHQNLEIEKYDVQGTEYGGMLYVKKLYLTTLNMETVSAVPHLTAGQIGMPEVAIDQKQMADLRERIAAEAERAGKAAAEAEQVADVAHTVEENALMLEAHALAEALGEGHADVATIVADHIDTARDFANGNGNVEAKDREGHFIASRKLADLAHTNSTTIVPWNGQAKAMLDNLLAKNTDLANGAEASRDTVHQEVDLANQALEQARNALRTKINEEADTASAKADATIAKANAANALVEEANILKEIERVYGSDTDPELKGFADNLADVRRAVAAAHMSSSEVSNPHSAECQAQDATNRAADANNLDVTKTTQALLKQVGDARAAIQGVDTADQVTDEAITQAEDALKAARQKIQRYVAAHPLAEEARAHVEVYNTEQLDINGRQMTMPERVAQMRGLLNDFQRINPAMQAEIAGIQGILDEVEGQVTNANRDDSAEHFARVAQQQMDAARAVDIANTADAGKVLEHLNNARTAEQHAQAAVAAARTNYDQAEQRLVQLRQQIGDALARMNDAPGPGEALRDDQLADRAETAANQAEGNGTDANALFNGITDPALLEQFAAIPEANQAIEDLVTHHGNVWNHANRVENPNNARSQADTVRGLVGDAQALDVNNDQDVPTIANRIEQARAACTMAIHSEGQSADELERARQARQRLNAAMNHDDVVNRAELAALQARAALGQIGQYLRTCQPLHQLHEADQWAEALRQSQFATEQTGVAVNRARDARTVRDTTNDLLQIQAARQDAEAARDNVYAALDAVLAIRNSIVANANERERIAAARRAAADALARGAGARPLAVAAAGPAGAAAVGPAGAGAGAAGAGRSGLGGASSMSEKDKEAIKRDILEARRRRGMAPPKAKK